MNNEAQSEAKLTRASRMLGAKIVGALVVAMLALTFASPSKALIMNFGEVEASLDTVISIGASVRLSERNTKFLPSGNGGPKDITPLTDSGVAALAGGITGAAFAGAAQAFGITLPAGHDTTAGAAGAYLAAAAEYGGLLGAALQGNVDATAIGTAGLRFGLYAGTAGAAQGARARESIGIDVSGIDFTATAGTSGLAVGVAYVGAFTTGAIANPAAAFAQFNAVNDIYLGLLTIDCGTVDNPSDYARANGTGCFRAVTEQYNYDGSINRDNGRLNFDFGDVISAPVKATPELAIGWGDWRAFVRASAFWDVVLTDPASWRRDDPSSEARPEVIRNIELLDAYVSKDGEFLGSAYTIRAGRQVINWGEATFVTGGNAVFNPISVPAIRRPGSELKEAFLPVEAIHVAYSMPGDLTLEGYYGFWDRFRLDRGGSPFASQDTVYQGSTTPSGAWIGSGLYSGFGKANCDVYGTRLAMEGVDPNDADAVTAALAGATAASPFTRAMYKSMLDSAAAGGRLRGSTAHANDGTPLAQSLEEQNCNDPIHPNDDFTTFSVTGVENPHLSPQTPGTAANVPHTIGNHEEERRAYGDSTGEILRLSDVEPRTEGSWGVALRWYSEALNSTEFGFYYQNYDSRIPYSVFSSEGAAIGVTTIAPNASDQGRSLDNIGCGSWYAGLAQPLALAAAGAEPNAADQLAAQRADPRVAGSFAAIQHVSVEDPGLFFATDDGSDGIAEALARQVNVTFATDVFPADHIRAGQPNPDTFNAVGTYTEGDNNEFLSAKYTDGTNAYAPGKQVSMARAMEVVCRTALANESTSLGGLTALDKTGEMRFGIGPRTGLHFVYPENLQVVGASFNTTLFGWGLQGELAYRPDFPLGLDSTAQTIAALVSGCFLQNYGPKGTTIHDLLGGLSTGYEAHEVGCTDQYVETPAFTNVDVLNFDIGTTATFTRSSPLVRLLRADLGILLTEVAGVYAHGIDKYKVPTEAYNAAGGAANASNFIPLADQCTSGSDLPLGGIFALDPRAEGECRATEFSMGMVLLGQLQYNNVFGTAIGLRPTMSWSYGLLGRSPSPAGTWREGVGSFSVSMSAEYLNAWSGSVAYVHYLGDELYTENLDRNFFSASLSYAF